MKPSPIRQVSDTALWVAMYRALESDRSDALFKDPFARRMAGERGAAIVRALPLGQAMAWAMAVRTAVIDELVLRAVARGATTVLNLGAGLDARAFRLALPPALRWIDADLPAVIEHRRACMEGDRAACDHSDVVADVCDPAAIEELVARVGRDESALVVTEGLLVYMSDGQVESLARELHSACPVRWWLTDLIAPLALHSVGMFWQPHLGPSGVSLRFAPPDSIRFFEALGWHEREYRSIVDEAIRLGRAPPFVAFFNGFGSLWGAGVKESLRRASGVALLEARR
ncbi:MAG: SAM-dependent methyltransferase [Caldimonas sp.]